MTTIDPEALNAIVDFLNSTAIVFLFLYTGYLSQRLHALENKQ